MRTLYSSVVTLVLGAILSTTACSGTADDAGTEDQAVQPYATKGGKLCGGLPRVDFEADGLPSGFCLGLIADRSTVPALRMPRGVVELPTGQLVVASMSTRGWDPNVGSVWLLTPSKNGEATTYTGAKLLDKLDRPNGVALGPDPLDASKKRVYVGTPSKIFRFDPLEAQLRVRDVITDLPADADNGGHPLKQMVFDGNDVYVNTGSSSDQCQDKNGRYPRPCPDEAKDRAGIRHYVLGGTSLTPQPIGGKAYEMYARGLRNSMALAIHPTSKLLLQGENGLDTLGDELPHEELNVIEKGKHYGWPYCYDNDVAYSKFGRFDCSQFAKPALLLPAHAAPLGMRYYTGGLFPEAYRNKLIVAYHGYDPKGHRLVLVDVDANGRPTGAAPKDIIRKWEKSSTHPEGAPVDVLVASDGSVILTDDKNNAILRLYYEGGGDGPAVLDPEHGGSSPPPPASGDCDEVANSSHPFAKIERELIDQRCLSCHGSTFFRKCDMTKNASFLRENKVDGTDPMKSEFYLRITGQGNRTSMPPGAPMNPNDPIAKAVADWIKAGAPVP